MESPMLYKLGRKHAEANMKPIYPYVKDYMDGYNEAKTSRSQNTANAITSEPIKLPTKAVWSVAFRSD